MEESELAQRARYFYYTTRLPVFWYRGASILSQLPESPSLIPMAH